MYLIKHGQKSNYIDGLSHWKFFCYSKIVKAIPFKFFREEALFSRLFEPKSIPLPYCRSDSAVRVYPIANFVSLSQALRRDGHSRRNQSAYNHFSSEPRQMDKELLQHQREER